MRVMSLGVIFTGIILLLLLAVLWRLIRIDDAKFSETYWHAMP